MRADTLIHGSATRRSWATADDAIRVAELITELVTAGLVVATVGDDGAVEHALTSKGVKAAQQMAMCPDAHALVLLGALFGAGDGLN